MPMDLRGIGELPGNQRILAGGMEAGQKVSRKTWLLDFVPVVISSTEEIKRKVSIQLSPNPATSTVEIKNITKEKLQISIVNILGQTIFESELGQVEKQLIDCSQWKAGNYQIVVRKDNQIQWTEPLMKL